MHIIIYMIKYVHILHNTPYILSRFKGDII